MFKPETLIIHIICITLCIVGGQEKKMTLYFNPAQVNGFRTAAETCGKEYGVDPKDVRKILTWTLPDDKAHKQFLYCILLQNGYIKENGHINIDEASKLAPINGTQEAAMQVYKKCDILSQEEPIEAAYELTSCYYNHFILLIKKPED